jgi:plastocyanin
VERELKSLDTLALLLGLLSVAAVACGGGDDSTNNNNNNPTPVPAAPTEVPEAADSGDTAPVSGGVAVTMQDPSGSGEYIFDPAELSSSVGETVTFDLTSEGEFHTFTILELGVNQAVNAGETASIEVTFDTAGTYELVCIPHQALGMVGTITVK